MDTINSHAHLRPLWRCLVLLPHFNTGRGTNSAFTPSDRSRSSPLELCNHCELAANAPSSAKPISPPDGVADKSYYCYVDFQNRIYEVNWTNKAQYPNLSSFPETDGTVHKVNLSDEVNKAFAGSILLNYGTEMDVFDVCTLSRFRSSSWPAQTIFQDSASSTSLKCSKR